MDQQPKKHINIFLLGFLLFLIVCGIILWFGANELDGTQSNLARLIEAGLVIVPIILLILIKTIIKTEYMKWIKRFLLLVCVYSATLGILYYQFKPLESKYGHTALINSLIISIPITILVVFVWSKFSNRFNL